MDNRRVKFCLKILSCFGKIIRKPQGVNFFGAPCISHHIAILTSDYMASVICRAGTV